MKPTIMLSSLGATPGLTSRAGSVLPGLIVVAYEGAGVLSEDETARIEGLQFFAHEAAHLWRGRPSPTNTRAMPGSRKAAPIRHRLIALEHPTYDWLRFHSTIAECVNLTRRRGVESARERNENRAYYACGAVFALIAESASGRSFFTSVKTLVDSNRAAAS